MSEPSQRAKDISKEICDSYNATLPLRGLAIVIQAALDAERADMDREIGAAMKAKDQRIAELGGIAKGIEDLTIRKDQRIAELEALLASKMDGIKAGYELIERDSRLEIQAQAALLDRAPHTGREAGHDGMCPEGCPACAWAKLKEGK